MRRFSYVRDFEIAFEITLVQKDKTLVQKEKWGRQNSFCTNVIFDIVSTNFIPKNVSTKGKLPSLRARGMAAVFKRNPRCLKVLKNNAMSTTFPRSVDYPSS